MKYAVMITANAVLARKENNIALNKMRCVVPKEEAVGTKAIVVEIPAVKRNSSA